MCDCTGTWALKTMGATVRRIQWDPMNGKSPTPTRRVWGGGGRNSDQPPPPPELNETQTNSAKPTKPNIKKIETNPTRHQDASSCGLDDLPCSHSGEPGRGGGREDVGEPVVGKGKEGLQVGQQKGHRSFP